MVVSSYYSLTTLSTVGFGDLYPRTDYERLTGALIIFCGLLCFSYVNQNLRTTVEVFNDIWKDFDDSENLDRFLNMLKFFNGGQEID